MSGGIFISYRRSDNQAAAGRLYDNLRRLFLAEQIFIDVASIGPGLDFVDVIKEKLASSNVMLVVIGPRWLSAQDNAGRRRLDNAKDLVRIEVHDGLTGNLRVIPVLVDEAKMPSARDLPSVLKPLATRNAVQLSHPTFPDDVERLGKELAKLVTPMQLRLREAEINRSKPAPVTIRSALAAVVSGAISLAEAIYGIVLGLKLLLLRLVFLR
jgi:TIR domain